MASPLTENAESVRTLISWKEIAAFLDRSQRTMKRWERERGLPVHRVPGGERGSVFAYSNELTDWLKGKASELEAGDRAPGNLSAREAAGQSTNSPSTIFGDGLIEIGDGSLEAGEVPLVPPVTWFAKSVCRACINR